MNDSSNLRSPIAVVGASALFPGSIDASGFWRDILAGSDLLSDVPASHWLIEDYYDADPSVPDKTYAKRGGFLNHVDFDAIRWGIPPNLVPETDTSQLLALIVAQKVLEDASAGQPDSLDRSRMSVILGCTSGQELMGSMVSRLQRPVWVKALRESGLPESEVQEVCERISASYTPWRESTFPGLLGNVVAGRVANRLNLGGTNCVIDAACASTLSALSMAVHELQLGDSDFVITGGVDTMNDIFMYVCFSKTPALSPTGDCRPFSDRADGTMLGEGLGMVALKRLADAEAAGDRIYAVIHGVGASSDGRAKSVYAPRPEGQAQSLRRAYQQAGYGPDSVELIEAHGTGTKAGDAAEFAGLDLVFGESARADRQWCALGSVKSQIGHAKSAAGAAGIFKAVMALSHRTLPPTIKVDAPNPALKLEQSAFHLTTRARPWVRGSDHPRRASVSAFGFGGSNFHVALSEYAGQRTAPRLRTLPTELVAFSAGSAAALVDAVRQCSAQLKAEADVDAWRFVAFQSCQSFDPSQPARLALQVKDNASLVAELDRVAGQISAAPEQGFATPAGTHYGVGAQSGDVAFMFPGQGSQYIDMGSELAQHFDTALSAWDRAADCLPSVAGEGGALHSLANVVFPITAFTPEAAEAQRRTLNATEWTQPAIGCTSLAMLGLLGDLGIRAAHVAGHSFGEVMALHAAGALSADDALRVARRRGELMADAAKHPGAMIALSESIERVESLLRELIAAEPLAQSVVVANHNGPRQVVLSGRTDGIEAAARWFEDKGITSRRLAVATAFHSEVVAEASATFAQFLEGVEVQAPKLSTYANSSAARYPEDPKAIRATLAEQLSLPVRFVELVEAAYAAGARTFIEVGPGAVLSGLTQSILAGREHKAVCLDRKGKHGVSALFEGVAALCAAGVPLSLKALWQGFAQPMDPATQPKPKLTLALNGSNYGKPYPPVGGAAALPPPNPEATIESRFVQNTTPPSASASSPASPGVEAPQAASQPAPSVQPLAAPAQQQAAVAVTPPSAAPATAPTQLTRALTSYPTATDAGLGQPLVSGDWARAYAEVQRQTADVHATYMNAMASSHLAFLDTVERSFLALSGAAAQPSERTPSFGVAAAAAPSLGQYAAPSAAAAPPIAAPAVTAPAAPVVVAPVAAPPATPPADAPAALAPPAAPVAAPTAAPAAAVAAPVVAAPTAPSVDLHALLLAVVADKTGYPADMLNAEMNLEGDLGIDSIKRVEILSGMQERAPGLPQVDTSVMAKLSTLGQIVDYMSERLTAAGGDVARGAAVSAPAASALTAPAAAGAAPAEPSVAAPSVDLYALLLEVVSDKTGYPADMLNAEMNLEGDLGIDSIKRVEILSGMQDRAPGLPQVDTSVMAKLSTLGQIVEYMGQRLAASGGAAAPRAVAPGAGPVGAGAAAPLAAVPAAAAPDIDLHALLLDVVSEKTGYPAEMLNADMNLEGDLGIDSIKRVEILSGMQDRAPGLPQVDTSVMAKLSTLGQIVEYMSQRLGGAAAAATVSGAAAPAAGAPAVAAPASAAAAVASATTTSAPAPHAAHAAPALGRFVQRPVARAPLGMAPPGVYAGGLLAVTRDGTDLADEVVRLLIERGALAEAVDAVPRGAFGVVHLGALRQSADVDQAIAVNREAFRVAKQFVGGAQFASAAGGDQPARGLFVSVQDTGGRFGSGSLASDLVALDPLRAWAAGVAGLTRTIGREHPQVVVKAIDLQRGAQSTRELALRIVGEVLQGGPDADVGLRADGERLVLTNSVATLPAGATSAQPLRLAAGDVVVVSGGARGVTAATVCELGRQLSLRFVLLGRTAIQAEPPELAACATEAELKTALISAARASGRAVAPKEISAQLKSLMAQREIAGTLAELTRAGCEAQYVAVDVADTAALTAALESVRGAWEPIAAVIHGAGVIADKRIIEKTEQSFDQVFDTKVLGLRALLAATSQDPLKALLLFSSVAARTGNQGQSDYAMANEVLNLVARAEAARRGNTAIVRSLGWGPWESGMVTPELRVHFERMGVPLIPLQVGARMLLDELSTGEGQPTAVVLGGDPDYELHPTTEPRELTCEILVSATSHAYLADHAVDGVPTLPVVLAVEWLSRVAQAYAPQLRLARVKDIRVLRGIVLKQFNKTPERLVLRCKQVSNGHGIIAALELSSQHGVHYRCTAELVEPSSAELEPVCAASAVTAHSLGLEAWGERPLYDGRVLFHGPRFQLISQLEGISDQGAAGHLTGLLSSHWGGSAGEAQAWQTDPAALDGALQLAVIWSARVLGGPTLPTSVGSLTLHGEQPGTGPLHGTLVARSVSGARALSDVILRDSSGHLVAELQGVEMHLLPARASVESRA